MTKFFKKLLIVVNRAYSIPTLPDNILKIQSHPIIRVLRFLGGTSFLLLLTKAYLNYHSYFLYILLFHMSEDDGSNFNSIPMNNNIKIYIFFLGSTNQKMKTSTSTRNI